MSPQLLLVLLLRWIHIASATLAIGAPFFVRFALLPAAARVLDDDSHLRLKAAINARWKHFVYIIITLFIITGLINFLVPIRVDGVLLTARWKDFSPEDRRLYHMLFGFKMIAAFLIFTLASALAGRTNLFAPLRKNARATLTLLLLSAAVLLILSSALRYLPRTPSAAPAMAPVITP
jgi:uncharacterized membrane protein